MAVAATAAEDLLLRGEFAQALAESQARLAQRTLEVSGGGRDVTWSLPAWVADGHAGCCGWS